MKLRQRGIGMVGAIIAMVIAGLIVYGIIFYGPQIWESIQKATEGTSEGVPIYPDAELYVPSTTAEEELVNSLIETQMPANWSWHLYKSSAPIETIANWYRSQMSEWNGENDYVSDYAFGQNNMIVLAFSKNNDGAVVKAFQGSFTPRILLMYGPRSGIPYALEMFPPNI